MRWLLPLALSAMPALASDGIVSTGMLGDEDFHRLVACGAAPGEACQTAIAAWPGPEVTVALHTGAGRGPALKADDLTRALDAAVAELNGAGAAIRVVRMPDDSPAQIIVRPTGFAEGDAVEGEDGVPDGTVIGLAQVQIWWNDDLHITDATILIAADMNRADLPSIMLEEMVQAMGMTWDIENPAYEGVSVFAQDSNNVTVLKGQDAAALRLHYPPE
jgi:hypothetical protein